MITENVDRFDDWNELLQALDTVYTLSFKDVCRIMKASRAWVNLHIRPHVRCIYISNYGVDWVRIASRKLNRDFTEKIWFHTADFVDFIRDCTISVTKQARQVEITQLMTDENRNEYHKELYQLNEKLDNEENLKKQIKLEKEIKNLHEKYLKTDENTKFLYENRLSSSSKRKDVEHMKVDIDVSNFIFDWVAPHDLKDYGDTDELVYRKFFVNGYIRIELHVPDANGELGQKIFYVKDKRYIYTSDEKTILVSEKCYQEYQEKIGNV